METKTNQNGLTQKIEELKGKLDFLTKEQRELVLSRVIIEAGLSKDNSEGYTRLSYDDSMDVENLFKLADIIDVGVLKQLIVFAMRDNEIKYEDLYAESLKAYNDILRSYRKLAKELKLESAMDLSHLITYMIWNGYFSISKSHTYDTKERLLLPGMYSFDVFEGKGVCLAYSELLHKFLTECEKDSALLFCKVPTKKGAISFDYKPQIKRNSHKGKLDSIKGAIVSPLIGRLTNLIGNHAITLISEKGEIYAYDPTNLCALNIKDASSASIINGDGDFTIKPMSTLMLTPHSDPNSLFEKLVFNKINSPLTRKEYIYSFEEFMELMSQSGALLDDAYDSVHGNIECIDRQIKEIGDCSKALRKIRENNKNAK